MNKGEALAWLRGERSMCNNIQSLPLETWNLRIAQADAAMMQQAYYVLKAHNEGLMEEATDADR
jgi:hypothetical protein